MPINSLKRSHTTFPTAFFLISSTKNDTGSIMTASAWMDSKSGRAAKGSYRNRPGPHPTRDRQKACSPAEKWPKQWPCDAGFARKAWEAGLTAPRTVGGCPAPRRHRPRLFLAQGLPAPLLLAPPLPASSRLAASKTHSQRSALEAQGRHGRTTSPARSVCAPRRAARSGTMASPSPPSSAIGQALSWGPARATALGQ